MESFRVQRAAQRRFNAKGIKPTILGHKHPTDEKARTFISFDFKEVKLDVALCWVDPHDGAMQASPPRLNADFGLR